MNPSNIKTDLKDLKNDLKKDLTKTRDPQVGGPVSLPGWKRSVILRGALIGAAVAAVLTFIVFSIAASVLDLNQWGFSVGVATLIAIPHGAIIGPIVALVLSKGQAQRYLGV